MRRGKKPRWHEIYIIGDGTGWFKIGTAINSNERLPDLQIGNPRPLVLVKTFPVIARRAVSVERAIHILLSDYQRRGEWFDVSAVVAIAAANEATKDWHRYLKKQPKWSKIARLGQQAYIEMRSLE